ncbi:hypothetical protein NKH93_10870 [Mesorhizobium sp. M0954]|uniref:hypothetical protein n=1 Tax=Mesorhizobium sp. M0954 TaxID=2957032 RepID=UPI00333D7812
MVATTPAIGMSANSDADRRFFFAYTLFIFVTVLVGFVPHSVDLVHAVVVGHLPPIPLAIHIHAIVMGGWIILLLVQAASVATGRTALHRRLGMIAFAWIPLMVLMMVLVARSIWMMVAGLPAGAIPPDVLASTKTLLSNILIEQITAFVLFPLFALWGIAVRRSDPGAHRRLMILATLVILMAAVDRIAVRWLPTTYPASYDAQYIYALLWMAPVLIFDLVRRGRVHRVWVIGLACNLPFFVFNHFMWGSPRWLETAPIIMGLFGVSGWK